MLYAPLPIINGGGIKNSMDTHMDRQKAKPKPIYSHFLKFKKQVYLPTDSYSWDGGVQSSFLSSTFCQKIQIKFVWMDVVKMA